MVEVVVALTQRHESRDPVIAGRVAVVKWLVAEPVRERVDAERRLLHDGGAENTSVDETAPWWSGCQQDPLSRLICRRVLTPVTPSQAADQCGKDQGHEDDTFLRSSSQHEIRQSRSFRPPSNCTGKISAYQVVHMLPNDNGVLVEVRDVRPAEALRVLLHDEPADVRIDEALPDRIRVLVGIRVPVVGAVASPPPPDRALSRSDADCGQIDLQRQCGLVRRV